MGNRLTKIYTRTGDKGDTVLGDGSRTGKSSVRVKAMGDVDELNSMLGLLRAQIIPDGVGRSLQAIQHTLFDLGGELSIPGARMITAQAVLQLEQEIDAFNADLPPLKEFILPAGNQAVAICHLARAICRRAERSIVELTLTDEINSNSVSYLNRLSDLLFVSARVLARHDKCEEIYWKDR